jgi:hypothetical protein
MSTRDQAVGSSRKRISPPEHKKKRRADTHVKKNQTGFSYAEMQKQYRTPGRKKRKTALLEASFVDDAFTYARDNDSSYIPDSCIRTNTANINPRRDHDLTLLPHHTCTTSEAAGHGALTIHSESHFDEGKWSKEADTRLCAAIIAHADSGPFGGVNWKKVATDVGPHHCHVQCKVRWQCVKEMYESRDDEEEEKSFG